MKRPFIRVAVALALAGSSVCPTLAGEAGNPLVAERWKTRPLVIIAPNANDPTLLGLQQALEKPANREAFVEREMVLYAIVAGAGRRNNRTLTSLETDALLKALAVDARGPTKVILIGKDGGKKVEQNGSIDPATLFEIVDAMPMRQK